MSIVKISPKFQIVIPRKTRERLGLKPGQEVQVVETGGHFAVIPVRPIEEYRGFLAGIDTSLPRDDDRF